MSYFVYQKNRDRMVNAVHRSRMWWHQAFWAGEVRDFGYCPSCSVLIGPALDELEDILTEGD